MKLGGHALRLLRPLGTDDPRRAGPRGRGRAPHGKGKGNSKGKGKGKDDDNGKGDGNGDGDGNAACNGNGGCNGNVIERHCRLLLSTSCLPPLVILGGPGTKTGRL